MQIMISPFRKNQTICYQDDEFIWDSQLDW